MTPTDLSWLFTAGAARAVGWGLLHSVWQAALLAGALRLVLGRLDPARIRLRRAAASTALIGIVVAWAATTTFLLVDWRAHAACWTPGATVTAACASHGVDRAEETTVSASWETKRRAVLGWAPTIPDAWSMPLREQALLWTRVAAGAFAVWAGLLVILAFRGVRGLRALRDLRRGSVPAPDSRAEAMTAELARELGIAREVSVRESPDVDAPGTAGWRRPVVYLPPGLARVLVDGALRAVLAHELAHVARVDWARGVAERTVTAAFAFNPFVRWIVWRLREEREATCDAVAVGEAARSRRDYGETLLLLASFRSLTAPRTACVPLLGEGDLVRRIERVIGTGRSGAGRRAVVLVAALGFAVATTLGAFTLTGAGLASWAVMTHDVEQRSE